MKDEIPVNQASPASTPVPPAPRWMVVDDNEDLLHLLVFLLRPFTRAEIRPFTSAVEALAAFVAAPGLFQFVVTDLNMPEMNGQEFCHRLHELAPGLKVLLSTGSAVMTEEAAREGGFCGMVSKPYLPGALERALQASGMAGAL